MHYDEKVLGNMPDRPGGRTLAQWREHFGGFQGPVPLPGGGTAEISLAAFEGLSDHAYIDLVWITSTDGKPPPESALVPGRHILAEIGDEVGDG
ncbi:hypothetical protein [Nocardia fluminea]|uniref:hypothetical protein n=1 Tax=Nocardia fluminea TaxID=134984 RepID=UPI003419050D